MVFDEILRNFALSTEVTELTGEKCQVENQALTEQNPSGVTTVVLSLGETSPC